MDINNQKDAAFAEAMKGKDYELTQYHTAEARELFDAGIAFSIKSAAEQEPLCYARKWFAEGEVPKKEKNANGRMAWPKKYTIKETTERKIWDDDVPLYLTPPANKDSERLDWLNELPVHFIELDDFSRIDVRGLDVRIAIDAAMAKGEK